MFDKKYDVIVVGAGHAGVEAAAAAANLGSKTLLVTMNLQNIAQMSCNPAMGGVAKGQILREVDALGGYSGIVSDKTMIQFRMLNSSKGPAMWSPRVQSDRMRFSEEWRWTLEKIDNLDFYQEMVKDIIVEDNIIAGVVTNLGIKIKSNAVILTNGTFLNGLIHIGEKQFGGGRVGESASKGITEKLIELGFESGRMKTGTPPRVDARSLDFFKMKEQKGDDDIVGFSFLNIPKIKKQKSCHITYTNSKVHQILKEGFAKSPMFTGRIKSKGPRYCPSIEDKIHRFSDKNRHQIFVEPEGWNTIEIYVNGFSTSLPEYVQVRAMKEIPGFQNVKMFRPGYAIEYDYFPPKQLMNTLETKLVKGLFFAGQINGTTGYEEAAAQGLIAGINAHQKINKKEPFILKRNESYIGVLIDDLITKGTEEPYRMFTSRAEYRILLRQDNADLRLTQKSYDLGLASQERLDRVNYKIEQTEKLYKFLQKQSVHKKEVNKILEIKNSTPIKQSVKIYSILSRPHITIRDILSLETVKNYVEQHKVDFEIMKQVEIQVKYKGYIDREKENADKLNRLENIKIPNNFEYNRLTSLSLEAREKLSEVKPKTLSQASRISGVSPADVSVLLVYMGR